MMKVMNIRKNQKGFVSIVVSLVIMAILTLIVVGFASLMRREQRQAVDRQLSTAAFYAAESGVNDAIDSLLNDPSQSDITSCGNPPLPGYNNELDANGVVKYTCVLTDSTPTSLEKGVSDEESIIIPINTNGDPISSLKISWQAKDSASLGQFSNTMALPQAPYANDFIKTGMLRTTIIPYSNGLIARNVLRSSSRTAYLFPLAGSGTPQVVLPGLASDPKLISGECQANALPRECNVILVVNGAPSRIYLRLKAIYRPVTVSVRAYSTGDATGPELEMVGAQRVIDVTGKANDVLRRIQVRKPIETTYKYPEFAIESVDSICKRLVLFQTGDAYADLGGLTGDTSACEVD